MTLHVPEPRVLDIARMTEADRDRLVAALVNDGTFVLPAVRPTPADPVIVQPLLTRRDVAQLRRAADRATIAVVLLVAVIVVIQLGRLLIGGAA